MCGIVGVVDTTDQRRDVVSETRRLLVRQEHRGQLGTGLAAVGDVGFLVQKGNGKVREVLSPRVTAHIRSSAVIGQTRYATSGSRDPSLAQPLVDDEFALVFNGTLANERELAAALRERGMTQKIDVDTDLLRLLFAEGIRTHTRARMAEVFNHIESHADGAFNLLTLMDDSTLHAYRDHHGFHPLHYATYDGLVFFASEDSAINSIVPRATVHSVRPGEMVTAGPGRPPSIQRVREERPAYCFFEGVYFEYYMSSMEGVPLREARYRFGQELARIDTDLPDDVVVVPVPDSSIVAAEGYSEERRVPVIHALHKRKEQRNFIEGEGRREKARQKYVVGDAAGIRGKSVVVVDDSMVRGDTGFAIVELLRQIGATDIHFRFACPPIGSPCCYGIAFPSFEELLIRKFHHDVLKTGTLPPAVLALLAAHFGATTVRFLPVEGVSASLSIPRSELCMACVDGEYPTPAGAKHALTQLGVISR